MTDWALSETAYQERRDRYADGYVQVQRQAFIDGFEAAVSESEEFHELREWLEQERDEAQEKSEEKEDMGWRWYRQAMIDVLVKLSEVGCNPDE